VAGIRLAKESVGREFRESGRKIGILFGI